MPNGDPDFYEKEFPELESFFAPVASVLTEFGRRHNLALEKYYHQSPSWRFNFRHPQGGVASLDVMRESAESIKIYSYWWVDDYDTFSRSIKRDETPPGRLADTDLGRILEDRLADILSWEKGAWTQVASDSNASGNHRGETLLNATLSAILNRSSNNSSDRSGGSVLRIKPGAAKVG